MAVAIRARAWHQRRAIEHGEQHMREGILAAGLLLALGGCATTAREAPGGGPVEVKLIAFNDFHGNLEPPRLGVTAPAEADQTVRVPAGGAAYFASAVERLRAANPNNAVVSAGDMIGATPFVSAVFLDEPTVLAMNLIRVDFNAVGNHEFDKGRAELLRMQNGGCERHTLRQPCAVDSDFPGAKFRYLAANVVTETGETLFPAYGLRSFGKGRSRVTVGFIGLTLRETPTLVSPSGVAGLSFRDEAETINALIPKLKARGADAIVVLIHQGLATKVGYNDKSCKSVTGDLLPVLALLDPEVDLVVSGHTHNAYVCDYRQIDPTRPFLVTSAGRYGTMLTDINLTIDPRAGEVVSKRADNVIIQSEPYRSPSGEVLLTDRYPRYERQTEVAALVERYAAAAAPMAARVVGKLAGSALRELTPAREQVLGDLIADSQLAATRAPEAGGARIAFMNGFGVRADVVPAADGSVTFGQLFAAQPFGNSLIVRTFTGRQLRALLEQQFNSGSNTVEAPNMLLPSSGFTYAYDLSRPAGQRIIDMRLDGEPIQDDATYRVTMNSFLATGGDNFTVFGEGTDQVGGPLDMDALETYFASNSPLQPPVPKRIQNVTPQPAVPNP
jgi:5'-nucleotidase